MEHEAQAFKDDRESTPPHGDMLARVLHEEISRAIDLNMNQNNTQSHADIDSNS